MNASPLSLCSRTRLLGVLCRTGNVSKIWPAWGQYEFQHTQQRTKKYIYYFMNNLKCIFVHTSSEIKSVLIGIGTVHRVTVHRVAVHRVTVHRVAVHRVTVHRRYYVR
jgi:hypothetical protein